MNRAQRREFTKKAKERGISDEYIQAYLAMQEVNWDARSDIYEGAKVFLDVKKITSGKNYHLMVPEYKQFVESSEGVPYTAHIEKAGCLISMVENPKWLFWSGDLKLIKPEEAQCEQKESE